MQKIRKFILGSDWWTDCDDAVAIRLFCNSCKRGEADLLGIVLNACMDYSVPALDAFLRSMNYPLPIAIDLGATHFEGIPTYQKGMAERFRHLPLLSNSDAEEPVRMYRRMLAAENQVELVDIGFPQVLARLLQSPPDEFSPLNGLELVHAKVPCLWIMAGRWDADGEREHNFSLNKIASENAAFLCENWPGKIVFLGWEAGYSVLTGRTLAPDDPLKLIMIDHGSPDGRSSWDPMLVELAVTGDCARAGYDEVRGFASVDPADGRNFFRRDEAGPHSFVVKKHPDAWYAQKIEQMIQA